jgi:four helix bundle protein
MSRAHHKLEVWRRSIALVKSVYRASGSFPPQELNGLTTQMRRAAISVPGNIADGVGRSGVNDRAKFFAIARGSLTELDTYIVLARELGYLGETAELEREIDDVMGLLGGFMNSDRQQRTKS